MPPACPACHKSMTKCTCPVGNLLKALVSNTPESAMSNLDSFKARIKSLETELAETKARLDSNREYFHLERRAVMQANEELTDAICDLQKKNAELIHRATRAETHHTALLCKR